MTVEEPDTLVESPRKALPEAFGEYRVEGILGSGGFGTVYRARRGETVVALKVLASHFASRDMRSRFLREGTIRIDHPNVVKVLDAGSTPEGDDYIALELLEGVPLNKHLERAPLPAKDVVGIAVDVCKGLAAAHAEGIVHRDLKPGNVYLCDGGYAKVLDFGIAHWLEPAADQALTREGSVVGTPGYLSPEQAKGLREIDARTDIWALGVLLYQALSGISPFLRDSSVATILAVVLEEVEPLAKHAPSLPEGLAEIVDKCLAKDPDDRWASAPALAAALKTIDLDARPTRVSELPGAASTSLPADEQRVVALLLGTGVKDRRVFADAISDFGGEVIPMVGQRAIGVFGGQKWEGDETKRAVAAALAAREAADYVAVASGRATGARGTVSGDAVRAVERACATRAEGVAVDEIAARTLDGIHLEALAGGLFEVSRDTVIGQHVDDGPRHPLLGRDAEMAQLDAALRMMGDERRPVVAFISGPPGIGKSRLRRELLERISGDRPEVRVISGAGESHRREASLHLLRMALGATIDGSDAADRRSLIHEFCREALDDPAWAMEAADALGLFFGNEPLSRSSHPRISDPQVQSDRVRVALGDVLVGLAETAPLALVLDDAQWADTESLDFLDELLDRMADLPCLLVISARQELVEERPELFAAHDVIRVQPRGLVHSQVAALAESIAGKSLREKLTRAVAERSGGNPFFIEQIVSDLAEKQLLDSDFDELPVPLNVEAAVQSRLDHLPTAEKRLLQRAAVFGRSFSSEGLMAVGTSEPDGLIRRLVRRGLISSERKRGTGSGGGHYFRNALVADVAYRMLARHTAQETHRRAAGFLARRGNPDPEVLARHHELGGEATEAAAAYASAVLAAAQRGDTQGVLRCSERALTLGVPDGERFALYMARADALSFLGRREQQGHAVDAAIAHAASAGERARALSERVALLAATGAHERAIGVAEEAVAAAAKSGDPDTLAMALVRLGWACLHAGRLDQAEEQIEAATEIEAQLSEQTAAQVAAWLGQLATARGDLGSRLEAFQRAVELYRKSGDLRRAAQEECNLADTFNRLGAYGEAETALRGALEMTLRVGNKVAEAFALANLGFALTHLGRTADALEALTRADALAAEIGQRYLATAIRVYRARALIAAGRYEEAAREAEGAADEARRAEVPAISAAALTAAAEAWLANGDSRLALELSARAMSIRDEIGALEEGESEVFLAHARALLANGHEEDSLAVARRGQARVDDLARQIQDPELRRCFVEDVAENRALALFARGS